MWERFTGETRCAKNFLEEATKVVQFEASGSWQNESPYKEELERLRASSDMRLDGTLMLHEIKAGKAGDWRDLAKMTDSKSVVQKILQKSTNFLRRVVVPV